jgi:hypothetical protein
MTIIAVAVEDGELATALCIVGRRAGLDRQMPSI